MRLPATASLLACLWACGTSVACAQFAPRPEWREGWREVGALDYALTATAIGVTVAFEFVEAPQDGGWSGGPFLDATARTWLRVESAGGRKLATAFGDALFFATVGLAVGVDPLLVALFIHDEPRLAWQLFVINAEAISVAMLLSRPVQKVSARERPLSDDCERDPGYHVRCPARADSFYSGQTAGAFAAASATCMAHAHIPLYGGGWGDDFACLGAMLAASAVGALYVAGDVHWFTDVLLGTGVGLASGYLLPWLLHYRKRSAGPVAGLVPVLARGRAGLALVGMY